MPQLVPTSPTLPAPLVGARRTWARDAAFVGLVSGYTGPAWVLYGPTLHPHLIVCSLAAALTGLLLGTVAPDVLEVLRRRVSLRTLMFAMPVAAFFLGWGAAHLAALAIGAPVGAAARFGAVALTGQVAVFWLPYTVAAVMKGPRWPVVLAACLVSPILGPLTLLFAMLF